MYSCVGIARNIFSVRAHAVNKLPTKTISAKLRPTKNNPPNSKILEHFKTDSFFISIFVLKNNYIVVLSQQSVDWMFEFSFSESGTSTCSAIFSNSKDIVTYPLSAKIDKSDAVYFLISNICSRYITLVWTHSKFTFTHVCKSTHV